MTDDENPSFTEEQIALGVRLVERIIIYWIETGLLDSSLPPEEFQSQFRELMNDFLRSDVPIRRTFDYTEDILGVAEPLGASFPELYIVLVATWVEHWVNGVIYIAVQRRGHDEQVAVELIRATTLDSKFGALWLILELPELDPNILRLVRLVAEHRNAFVHYKWRSYSSEDDSQKLLTTAVVEEASTLVNELRGLRSLLFLGEEPGQVIARLFDAEKRTDGES